MGYLCLRASSSLSTSLTGEIYSSTQVRYLMIRLSC